MKAPQFMTLKLSPQVVLHYSSHHDLAGLVLVIYESKMWQSNSKNQQNLIPIQS